MFTAQVQQIDNAMRLGGQQSAKELVQAIANCTAPLAHRGPVGLDSGPAYHQPRLLQPPGVRRHSSVTQAPPTQSLSDAYGESVSRVGSRDLPLWRRLPSNDRSHLDSRPGVTALSASGQTVLDAVRTGLLSASDLAAISARLAGDLSAEGSGGFGGDLRVGRTTEIAGDMYTDGTVTHANSVFVDGPFVSQTVIENRGASYSYGPTYHYGRTEVDGKPINVTEVPVIVDLIWDGTTFKKVTRRVRCASSAGATATAVVFDCNS